MPDSAKFMKTLYSRHTYIVLPASSFSHKKALFIGDTFRGVQFIYFMLNTARSKLKTIV